MWLHLFRANIGALPMEMIWRRFAAAGGFRAQGCAQRKDRKFAVRVLLMDSELAS